MKDALYQARKEFLTEFLKHVPFDGWNVAALRVAEAEMAQPHGYGDALFEDGLAQLATFFSERMDEAMLEKLAAHDLNKMKIRDRIATGVLARLEVYAPYKDAVRGLMRFYALPVNYGAASGRLWQSADMIWYAAGDNATDFNHYSKRALLCAVLSSTILYWLGDDSDDLQPTKEFLARRIENVMQFGKVTGKVKGLFADLSCRMKPDMQ